MLLLSADGTQPGLGAWKAALDREGVPYDIIQIYTGQTRTAPTLTDATFADYAANHAKYQAVIVETGDLGHFVNNPDGTTSFLSALTDAEWATLAKFERTLRHPPAERLHRGHGGARPDAGRRRGPGRPGGRC